LTGNWDMAFIKSRVGRFATAIAIGLVAELLLLAVGTVVSSKAPRPWDERIWAATQEPAYPLVDWLEKAQHPGFEEQGAYFLLIPLIQWGVWTTIFYWLLSRRGRATTIESLKEP